jgi:hypothetical protein
LRRHLARADLGEPDIHRDLAAFVAEDCATRPAATGVEGESVAGAQGDRSSRDRRPILRRRMGGNTTPVLPGASRRGARKRLVGRRPLSGKAQHSSRIPDQEVLVRRYLRK